MSNKCATLWKRLHEDDIYAVLTRLLKYVRFRKERWLGNRFDREHGVSTTGSYLPDEIDSDAELDSYNQGYWPTTPQYFRKMMQSFPAKPEDHVFIDLGSGYGRALFIAKEYGFREYLGIEYVREFHEVAEKNVESFESHTGESSGITLFCEDASQFQWPEEDTVLFMFNPFAGEIMDRVLANISQSVKEHSRSFWILYSNPVHGTELAEHPMLEPVKMNAEFAIYKAG